MASTLDNTKSNILLLKKRGYNKSSVSKPYGVTKILRYDTIRKVYWFSNNRHWYPQDVDMIKTGSLIII